MGYYLDKTILDDINENFGNTFVLTQPFTHQKVDGELYQNPYNVFEMYLPEWCIQLMEDEGYF